MTIERDRTIRFHPEGTLDAVTRWVSGHPEGMAELFKNVRSQYTQEGRADVAEAHRVAIVLLQDQKGESPARIGILDVGGATLEDVESWSVWQDPEASSRGRRDNDEGNQGNGGKAYMYRMFKGETRILGVKDGMRNCKGFEGPAGSEERGTPGFMPDGAQGREVPVSSWKAELNDALGPYNLDFEDLPAPLGKAIAERQAFTLVEGVDPLDLHHGRIDCEELARRVVRHPQSTLAVEQIRTYLAHNGRVEAKELALERLAPHEGFETPRICQIPEELPLTGGGTVSTTDQGKRKPGRLVLQTSRDNMYRAHKNLRPRWIVMYRAGRQVIGKHTISDLVPNTPGSYFVYGMVELEALAPNYVEHGRRHPKPGPLTTALNNFVAEKIRELSREIRERAKKELDERALDEVHEENRKLDDFKNKFLPTSGSGDGTGGPNAGGVGPGGDPKDPVEPMPRGTVPDEATFTFPGKVFRLCEGMRLNMRQQLGLRVRDSVGRRVPGVEIEWHSSDSNVIRFDRDAMEARRKGTAEVWARIKGSTITSPKVTVDVWIPDHILLTPRTLEIPVGAKREIIAEVTNDEGLRATDVHLQWKHDADDSLIVRVTPGGWVTGNRQGKTDITAGAGDPNGGGVWSRISVEVTVVPSSDPPERGAGAPQLLLTGRDVDPDTGDVRPGDPDSPALWQEVSDYQNNIWWLNLESPDAAFCFGMRTDNPPLWRSFHAQKVYDMTTQVYMEEDFTRRGDDERKDYWASHKAAVERHEVALAGEMWPGLQRYVLEGELE